MRTKITAVASLALLTIFASSKALPSSDFGITGLIDLPTARMSHDGGISFSSAQQARTRSYAITYQATPWLETTFRYTGYNDFFFWDRNYEAKLKLWSEQDHLPQVAIGIRDLVGTGFVGSEYLVASKRMGQFDFTAGLGWGRLAGDGEFKNPLTLLSRSFESRSYDVDLGGKLASGSFFSGKNVGLFGGVSYQFDSAPLKFILEYNPDNYDKEISLGAPAPSSKISTAMQWDPIPWISLTVSRQHEKEWGLALSAKLDTKSLPLTPSRNVYRSSLDFDPLDLPTGINPQSWYDTLLFDAERSGLLLLEASLDESRNLATIVMGNVLYPVWVDALDLMVTLADLHLPITVSKFHIIIEEEGHRLHEIQMRRPSLDYKRNLILAEREIRIQPARPLKFVQHRTDFVNKKIIIDISVGNRVQLFDPDDPARYQIYAKIGFSMRLPKNWVLSGAADKNITNNFDESTRQSDSVIRKVRSDVIRYLKEGESGIDAMFIQKRGNLKSDQFYRIYAGVLESMYSGVGGEILYQPFESRLAFGLSANWVKQRDFDKMFKHLDYQTLTAFTSVYWATPFYNFDVAVHAGKYLARDIGATLEIRRTFDNGWMVGIWATKTNVSAEDFGEGSFDKGLFFKIPFNGFLGKNSRGNYSTRVRPIQRDGGQYLEDFTGNIWWDVRSARYDAFSESISRLFK